MSGYVYVVTSDGAPTSVLGPFDSEIEAQESGEKELLRLDAELENLGEPYAEPRGDVFPLETPKS